MAVIEEMGTGGLIYLTAWHGMLHPSMVRQDRKQTTFDTCDLFASWRVHIDRVPIIPTVRLATFTHPGWGAQRHGGQPSEPSGSENVAQ